MFSSYNFNHSFLGITDESTDDGAWSNMDKLTLRGKIADPGEVKMPFFVFFYISSLRTRR